jgi:hypothetical protein
MIATGAEMAMAINHCTHGAIHEKNSASNANGKETAMNAIMPLLAASPTPINTATPKRPMMNATMGRVMPITTPALPSLSPSFSNDFYIGRLTTG